MITYLIVRAGSGKTINFISLIKYGLEKKEKQIEDYGTRTEKIVKNEKKDIYSCYVMRKIKDLYANNVHENSTKIHKVSHKKRTDRLFELNELHTKIQECENCLDTIIGYLLTTRLSKIFQSIGEVRPKPSRDYIKNISFS